MLKEINHKLNKNIIKCLIFCGVIFTNHNVFSEAKYSESDSTIELISETYSLQPGDNYYVGYEI
jgi:hypothetical protein